MNKILLVWFLSLSLITNVFAGESLCPTTFEQSVSMAEVSAKMLNANPTEKQKKYLQGGIYDIEKILSDKSTSEKIRADCALELKRHKTRLATIDKSASQKTANISSDRRNDAAKAMKFCSFLQREINGISSCEVKASDATTDVMTRYAGQDAKEFCQDAANRLKQEDGVTGWQFRIFNSNSNSRTPEAVCSN